MKKALVVATIYNFVSYFERGNIRILQEQGYEVWCACNTDETDGRLEEMGVQVKHIPFARSPFEKANIAAYRNLVSLIKQEKFDLMHCHTPVGGVLGRLAADRCGVSKIVYTAHGFHFYEGAPKLNWLIFYPIEKWLATKTDVLITINREDYQRAKKHFKAGRVEYVPGVGVDVERIQRIVQDTDRVEKRKELGISKNDFLILSVGELNVNKNHQVIIRALAEVKNSNVQYVICGKGALEQELKQLAESLEIGDRVQLLGFRNDVIELMACADMFAHPSYREGLPVSVMEAMAAGLPVVGSKIRGMVDLIISEEKECLCEENISEQYSDKINWIMQDRVVRDALRRRNREYIEKFSAKLIKERMQDIYI